MFTEFSMILIFIAGEFVGFLIAIFFLMDRSSRSIKKIDQDFEKWMQKISKISPDNQSKNRDNYWVS